MFHAIFEPGDCPLLRHSMVGWRRKLGSSLETRRATPWLVEELESRAMLSTIAVSSTGDSGPGTLRAAIEQANLDSTQDTITFDPSVTGTITLLTALPDLSASTVIAGPGPSVLNMGRGGDDTLFTVFTVAAGADVTISGLRITGTQQQQWFGGGILNNGRLSVNNCTITGNLVGSSRFGFNGSGIDNQGTLTVINSTISGNSAFGALNPNSGFGGGIYNEATMSVIGSTISGNTGNSGGGIYNDGTLTILDSTVSGNSGGHGGGIFNAGTIMVIDSTVADNSSPESGTGGGIMVGPESGTGSGIFNTNSVTIVNSIVGDNAPGGDLVDGVFGNVVSLGHNLFSDTPEIPVDPTDLLNIDPLLAPLADNGGPTQTQALLPGSPAIGAGILVPGVTTDQRGLPRPQASAPDIGAFELQPPTVLVIQRHGVHLQPTKLVITFSQPMDAARAEALTNYSLVSAGPDHRFGTRNDHAIRLRSVVYAAASNTVTIQPIHRLPLQSVYQLTIRGTPTAGLTDNSGLFLDGVGTGQPGSDYIARITGKLLVPPILHKGGKQAAVAHGPKH